MTGTLFAVTFPLAVPFWLMMIVLPTWRWTERIVGSPWIALPPLVIYATVVLPHFGDFWAVMSSPSLDGLRELLGTAKGAAAIWAQFIAFDLLIGAWMYRDARRRGVSPLLMAPVLLFTIVLSPLGLLLYLVLRTTGAARIAPARLTDTAAFR
ncbi:ABA4-like family protein [Nakamurella alba]|uniref:ABA4-like family protein n=1 Tax=Nakamurella alba TaxID=2665158 RepID=UPI0018ABBFE8|nr:ABA4-like family protein [Nakamurella alba]